MVLEGLARDRARVNSIAAEQRRALAAGIEVVNASIAEITRVVETLPEELLEPAASAAKELTEFGKEMWVRLGLPRELFRS